MPSMTPPNARTSGIRAPRLLRAALLAAALCLPARAFAQNPIVQENMLAGDALERVEAEVTSRLRPFRFAIGLTMKSGFFHRFMMEIAPYRMAQGDHLTITTLTPASGPTTRNRPEEHSGLYALQT